MNPLVIHLNKYLCNFTKSFNKDNNIVQTYLSLFSWTLKSITHFSLLRGMGGAFKGNNYTPEAKLK